MAAKKTSALVVGAGSFARYHASIMLKMGKTVSVAGMVEPAEESRVKMAEKFTEAGRKAPPFYYSIKEFLAANKGPADCALIVSPHKFHAEQIVECLHAGMDVLCEKPMVLNVKEARRAIKARDETGRLLSVAFPGSFSPAVHKAKELIASGAIGDVMSISGYANQNWVGLSKGTWRMDSSISGGGFLFDTGSHLINTVVDIAGSDVKDIFVLQDNRGAPVEISSSITGRFKNGIFFSLCGEGNSIDCLSSVRIFGTKATLITGMWGERLRIAYNGKPEEDIPCTPSNGTFEQFLKVRDGKLANPCPPEVGLRFAKLMDLVRAAVAKK